MAHRKYSAKEVAIVLEASQGLISIAAQKLGCSRETIYNHIKKHKSVKKVIDGAREQMLDRTELRLWEQIDNGNMSAISLYLKTIGKSRGYVERQEITGEGGKPLTGTTIKVQESLERKLDRLIRMKNGLDENNQLDSDDN